MHCLRSRLSIYKHYIIHNDQSNDVLIAYPIMPLESIMACLSQSFSAGVMDRHGEPRTLSMWNGNKYKCLLLCLEDYCPLYQENPPSRDASPEVDDLYRIRCSCKSTCQRCTSPCKEAGSFSGELCKCGMKRNHCRNQVTCIFLL